MRHATLRFAALLGIVLTVALAGPGAHPARAVEPVSDLAVFANPSTLSVARGGSVSTTVITTPWTGFHGNLVFTATHLPCGVTAVFAPATGPAGSHTTLTIAAASNACPGTATVTVGAAPSADQFAAQTSVSLTVT